MKKNDLRWELNNIYSNCLDYEELELRRIEIMDLNERTYQLEKSCRDDMEEFKNVKNKVWF